MGQTTSTGACDSVPEPRPLLDLHEDAMTIDPGGFTMLGIALSIGGLGMAVASLYMKRRIAQIDRQLEAIRTAKDAGENTGGHRC